jgi:hypothetical protein
MILGSPGKNIALKTVITDANKIKFSSLLW